MPANTSMMRIINRSSVITLLRDGKARSRSGISRELGVSLSTVMRIIDELKNEQLVVERQIRAESTGGRRPSLVEFNGSGYSVVSIDIRVHTITSFIVDLLGNISKEITVPLPDVMEVDCYESIEALIESTLSEAKLHSSKIRGIAVGVPGIVRTPDGEVSSRALRWDGFQLGAKLRARFDLPIFVENDANVEALGEMGFGAAVGARNAVFLSVGMGLGAGIVADGVLYRGAHRAAGSIGAIPTSPKGIERHDGVLGDLVNPVSPEGFINRARYLLSKEIGHEDELKLDLDDIFAAARDGKPWANTLFNEINEGLSFAVANVIALLDPEVIVVGGEISTRIADFFLKPIIDRLKGYIPVLCKIVVSQLGTRATAMGSIMMVLYGTTEHTIVRSSWGPSV